MPEFAKYVVFNKKRKNRIIYRFKRRWGCGNAYQPIRCKSQQRLSLFAMAKQAMKKEERFRIATRKPQRISITIPQAVYEGLGKLSFREGRSMSNLASFILEKAIREQL